MTFGVAHTLSLTHREFVEASDKLIKSIKENQKHD